MALQWIDNGRRFSGQDILFWKDRATRPLQAALEGAHTVVLGPHAGHAFPRELQTFIDPALTLRQQMDFSDWITGPLGRAWAQADEGVLFIENPHARLVSDPNRAPSVQPMQDLRECFARIRQAAASDAKLSLAGIDGIRPITFSGQPVLREPRDHAEWLRFEDAWRQAAAQGVDMYRATCEQVIRDAVARSRRLGRRLSVVSLHDTMNTQLGANGAIHVERPAGDRLPPWVNLGNLGDARGEPDTPDGAVSMPAARARQVQANLERTLQSVQALEPLPTVTLNHPYKGAHETRTYGALLMAEAATDSGVIQIEFRRESLLGAAATRQVSTPGTDWPKADAQWLARIAQALATSFA